MKVQKIIDKITKNNLKIKIMPEQQSLHNKRKMMHTPVDGLQKVEDQNEHIESLAQNKWLRKFVETHERKLDEKW